MNISNHLFQTAQTYPDHPAVSLGRETRLNYRTFALRVSQLAETLVRRFTLRSGDRVALVMSNSPEYLEVLYAIWCAGLTAVPVNAKLHVREFNYILSNSGARLCFATPDLAGTLVPLVPDLPDLIGIATTGPGDYSAMFEGTGIEVRDVDADAVAWLFYTSGTTGQPKGAMLSHRNLRAMSLAYFADIETIMPGECIIHAAPMSHGSGLYALPHIEMASNHVIPESGGFDPAEIVDLLSFYRDSSFFFAPTMVTRLVRHVLDAGLRLSNVKTLIYGGAPMYLEDLRRALEVVGPNMVQIYGQGESPMTITALSKAVHADSCHPQYFQRLSSVGVPRTGLEVRVVDGLDHDVPTGDTGEIVVRGDVVMRGYWNNSEASAETLRGGWLHTGDLGAFDEAGVLTLKDRSKDLIISGGSNIYPREVEEILLRHPGVLEAAVLGRPHRDWGEEVIAFIVRKPSATVAEEELDRLCLDNIARFKRPREYLFIESLPKNNYGKVLKRSLREQMTHDSH